MICIELNRIKKARNAAANARNSVFIAYWNKVADQITETLNNRVTEII